MFAIWIMALVAIIAFATVVAVMYFGTREGEAPPHEAHESNAVSVWGQRANAKEAKLKEQAEAIAAAEAAAKAEEEAAKAAETAKAEEAAKAQAAAKPAATESAGADTGRKLSDVSDEEREAKRQAALERKRKRAEARAAKEAAEG